MKPDLSIIIPAYNAQSTIADVLDKCLKPTPGLTVEVILVDDCSSDQTVEIAKSAHGNDPRVRFHPNAINSGPGPSRNAGLTAATGEYTLFLDADDYVDLTVAADLITQMRTYSIDVAVAKYRELKSYAAYDEAKPTGDMSWRDCDIFSGILRGASARVFKITHYPRLLETTNFPWNKICLTTFLRENTIEFPDLRLNEDILPHWHILCSADKILLHEDYLVTHFVSPFGGNATNQVSPQRMDAITAIEGLSDFLLARNVDDRIMEKFYPFSIDFLLWAKNLVPEPLRKDFRDRAVAVFAAHPSTSLLRASVHGNNVIYPLHHLIYG